jgi:hypothetical protein
MPVSVTPRTLSWPSNRGQARSDPAVRGGWTGAGGDAIVARGRAGKLGRAHSGTVSRRGGRPCDDGMDAFAHLAVGRTVGADSFGNRYYRDKRTRGRNASAAGSWQGKAEGSAVPPQWNAWLQRTVVSRRRRTPPRGGRGKAACPEPHRHRPGLSPAGPHAPRRPARPGERGLRAVDAVLVSRPRNSSPEFRGERATTYLNLVACCSQKFVSNFWGRTLGGRSRRRRIGRRRDR